MASILLLGNPGNLMPIAGALSAHKLYLLSDDAVPAPDGARYVPVSSVDDLPERLDAIFELSCAEPVQQWYNFELLTGCTGHSPYLFVNTLSTTATAACAQFESGWTVCGVSYVPSLFGAAPLIEASSALQNNQQNAQKGFALLEELLGRPAQVVEDRVGLVSARVLAMVINEAAFALMESVADAADIDLAMKLGTNYPQGPLHWCDTIGAEVIVNILEALYGEYGQERYRPCVLLKQYARAGKTFF